MAANPNYKKLRLPQLKKGQSPSEVQNKIKIFTDFVNSENPSPMLAKGMVMDWEKQPKNIRSFLERPRQNEYRSRRTRNLYCLFKKS